MMRWISSVLSLVVAVTVSCTITNAAIPQVMNYQGVLRDASGTPVPDGSYEVTFRLYDSPGSGGISSWTETQTVTAKGGLFNVALGSVMPIPEALFTADNYISIQVGADPEMTPRTRLTSVGYAFQSANADKVGGFAVPDLVPPALWSHAFREYILISNPPAEAIVFTVPSGKKRYVTGIYCSMAYALAKVDGVAILSFNDPSGASTSWQSGGGAPIVVDGGQTFSIESPLNPSILVTGYEF